MNPGRRFKRPSWLTAVLAAGVLFFTSAALHAQSGGLAITTASVNASNNLVVSIVDPNGRSCGSARITFGNTQLTVVGATTVGGGYNQNSTSTITAKLPAGVSAGAYSVDVTWGDASDTTFEITIGTQGAAGPVGPQGAVGATGAQGPAGPIGATGAVGVTGAAGLTGPVGSVGAAGATGAVGAKGLTGPTGATGAIGAAGATGATGPGGPVGATGLTGATGPTGPIGAIGATGATGPAGPVGAQGATGATGAAGSIGLAGIDGAPGGTGPAGDKGATGATGATGPVGPQGVAGAAGPAGSVGPQGPQGATGPMEDLSDLVAEVTALQAQVTALQALQASIVPGAPTITNVTAGVGTATVSFTPPAPNNGNAPTSYTVTASGSGSSTLLSSGFESPAIATNSYTYESSASYGPRVFGDWVFSSTSGIINGPSGAWGGLAPYSGAQYALLQLSTESSTLGEGSIETANSFNLNAGQSYTVSFAQARRSNIGGDPLSYAVTIDGTQGQGSTQVFSRTSQPGETWQVYSATFTAASSGPVTLGFHLTSPPGYYDDTIFLDAVSVTTAVPIVITASGSTSPITVSGLTDGQSYTFTVTASNSAGTGASSAASPAVTIASVPGAPVITSVAPGDSSAVITVDPNVSNGGAPILYWEVTTSPATTPVISTSNVITVPGLTDGQSYAFTVIAVNSVGASASSTPSAPVTIGLVQSIIVQVDDQQGTLIDAMTGDLIQQDGSEVDPVTGATVVPAPSTLPPLAVFSGYLLTLDPSSGLYTSFFGTTVDPASGIEYDPFGDALDEIDLTQEYYVTTAGTVVAVLNPSVQLDPLTLKPINSNPYTVEPTPVEYQSYYTYPEVGW